MDQGVRDRAAFTGLTIKAILFLGFGLTFGIWLFAGYYFTNRIRDVESRSAAINAPYLRASGTSFFSPAVARVMLDDYVRHLTETGIADRFDSLSEREREVFQLVAEGRSNKEIAELRSVSPTTVETHRAHVLQKLDVHNTAELVLYAVRRGVIS